MFDHPLKVLSWKCEAGGRAEVCVLVHLARHIVAMGLPASASQAASGVRRDGLVPFPFAFPLTVVELVRNSLRLASQEPELAQ